VLAWVCSSTKTTCFVLSTTAKYNRKARSTTSKQHLKTISTIQSVRCTASVPYIGHLHAVNFRQQFPLSFIKNTQQAISATQRGMCCNVCLKVQACITFHTLHFFFVAQFVPEHQPTALMSILVSIPLAHTLTRGPLLIQLETNHIPQCRPVIVLLLVQVNELV
jgi:hypothetical protein